MLISNTRPQTPINPEQSISSKSNSTQDEGFQKLAENLKNNDSSAKPIPFHGDPVIDYVPSDIIPFTGDPVIDYVPTDLIPFNGIPTPGPDPIIIGKFPILGTDDDDVITGSANDDIILARGGDDFVRGSKGDDDINGGAGDDKLRGGRGNDTLDGGLGNDILHGGRGDDRLIAGAGDNVLNGGRGTDTAVLDGFVAEYNITQEHVNGKIVISLTHSKTGDTTTLRNIENVEFRGYGAAVGGRTPEPTVLDINGLRNLIPDELNK